MPRGGALKRRRRRLDKYLAGGVLPEAASLGLALIVQGVLGDEAITPTGENLLAALWAAIRENHVEVVRVLLADRRLDPSAADNQALLLAVTCGWRRMDVTTALLSDSRVSAPASTGWRARSFWARTRMFIPLGNAVRCAARWRARSPWIRAAYGYGYGSKAARGRGKVAWPSSPAAAHVECPHTRLYDVDHDGGRRQCSA
jgi:hypothetical protein